MGERQLQHGFSGKPRFKPDGAELPCLENRTTAWGSQMG